MSDIFKLIAAFLAVCVVNLIWIAIVITVIVVMLNLLGVL